MQIKINRYGLLVMLAKVKNGKKQNNNVMNELIHSTIFIQCQYALGIAIVLKTL